MIVPDTGSQTNRKSDKKDQLVRVGRQLSHADFRCSGQRVVELA